MQAGPPSSHGLLAHLQGCIFLRGQQMIWFLTLIGTYREQWDSEALDHAWCTLTLRAQPQSPYAIFYPGEGASEKTKVSRSTSNNTRSHSGIKLAHWLSACNFEFDFETVSHSFTHTMHKECKIKPSLGWEGSSNTLTPGQPAESGSSCRTSMGQFWVVAKEKPPNFAVIWIF